MNLQDLFEKASVRPEIQGEIDAAFWRMVEARGVRWRKGDPIPQVPRWMLIALAAYSGEDIRIAEAILDRGEANAGTIGVAMFRVLDIRDMTEFGEYIPRIGDVY